MGDDHAARAYPHLFIRFEHTLKLVIAAPAKPYHQLNLSGPNIPAHNDLEAKLVAVLTMTDPSGVKVYGIGEKARVLGRRRVRERTKGIREAGCGGLASVMARIVSSSVPSSCFCSVLFCYFALCLLSSCSPSRSYSS